MTEEEKTNDEQIPAELKEGLAKKVQTVLDNIGKIEAHINEAIDEAVEESEEPITISEIMSALIDVMKKMNSKDIMQLIN